MTTTTILSDIPVYTTERRSVSLESTKENRLSAAIEHARRLTHMHGYENVDVALAWETVEEVRFAQLRSQSTQSVSCQSMFARYCSEYPSALECRSYDC